MSQPTPPSSLPWGGRLALAWVRCYTAGLEDAVRHDRCEEVAGDVWDHTLDAGFTPTLSRAVARRMLLGVPADLSWRTEQARRQRSAARERVAMIEPKTTGRRLVAASLVFGVVQVTLIGTAVVYALFTWFPEDSSGAGTAFLLIALLGFVLGLWGVASLIRTRRVGCGVLTFATLLMTFPFYWSPWMTAIGIGLGIVHLLAFAWMRDGAEPIDSRSVPRGATA